MNSRLWTLLIVFAPLSLSSFGGGQSIIASVNHQAVAVRGWISQQQFADLFGLSRAAPGPTTLIAALIGWQVNGFLGAIVAALAIFVPSSIFFVAVMRLWTRYQGTRWSAAVAEGLLPVTVGLVFAGGLAVVEAVHMTIVAITTAVVSMALLAATRVSPFVLIGAALVIYGCIYIVSPQLVL